MTHTFFYQVTNGGVVLTTVSSWKVAMRICDAYRRTLASPSVRVRQVRVPS